MTVSEAMGAGLPGGVCAELRGRLLGWWQDHGRHGLPWKRLPHGGPPAPGEWLHPYGIWIAEVMLQQTQVRVVIPYWQRWLERFPDRRALAEAGGEEVLLAWQGLGYYARAGRLQQAARRLLGASGADWCRLGDGAWPVRLDDWQALPGLGRTTAAGIVSAAFDAPEPILDGNVRRVLARLTAWPQPPARAGARFWDWSAALLDRSRPRDFNQALMDLGALVCTPRQPDCPGCPWRGQCAAYAGCDPHRYPVAEARSPRPHHVIGVGVVLNDAGEVLIDQRLPEGLLGGLWEFPGGKQEPGEAIAATIARELQEELAIGVEVGEHLISLDHAYSHRRLRFEVHLCRWRSGEPLPLASQQVRWVRPADLDAYPFPAANSRIIAALRARLAQPPVTSRQRDPRHEP